MIGDAEESDIGGGEKEHIPPTWYCYIFAKITNCILWEG